jgi:alpha-tubulin suppressor-like RCC1 family protein
MGRPCAAACGEEHSVLLTRAGQLYAAGSNAAGAAGLPVVQLFSHEFTAVPLPGGEAVVAADAGGYNTAAVTSCGELLVCGCNAHGQCGVGRVGGSCYLLTDVGPAASWHGLQRTNQQGGGGFGEAAAGQGVVVVACGRGTTYAATQQGDVYSWGQGGQGALR